jgi:hypothetical protein
MCPVSTTYKGLGRLTMQYAAVMLSCFQDATAPKFKEISKLVQEPRMDSLGLPNTSSL